jgi:hypothetical protein
MTKRRSHGLAPGKKKWPPWAIAAGLLVLASGGLAKRAAASAAPSGGAVKVNPHTGERVIQRGTRHLSDEEVRAVLAVRGFPDVDRALAIVRRESGGWTDAVVDTSGMSPDELRDFWGTSNRIAPEVSVGLFQINTLAHPEYDRDALKDPHVNADAAFTLSQGGTSWTAWGK